MRRRVFKSQNGPPGCRVRVANFGPWVRVDVIYNRPGRGHSVVWFHPRSAFAVANAIDRAALDVQRVRRGKRRVSK